MDIDKLLQPVAGESPVGENCGYKPRFREMRSLCEYLAEQAKCAELGRMLKAEVSESFSESDKTYSRELLSDTSSRLENQIRPVAAEVLGGDVSVTTIARALRARAEGLLGTDGKDLAVVVRLAFGETAARDAAGLAACLELFEALFDQFGDQVHPQPDDGDAFERTNLANELLAGQALEAILRDATIVSAGPGKMLFRDAEVLDGILPREGGGAGLIGDEHLLAIIDASVAAEAGIKPAEVTAQQRLDAIVLLIEPVAASAGRLRSIASKLGAAVEGARVLKLLERALKRLQLVRDGVASKVPGAAPVIEAAPTTPQRGSAAAVPGAAAAVPGTAISSTLATREDARQAILKIAEFLEQTEPSHPSALFLQRAARLLQAKSFFDIVQDLLPGSPVDEITHLTGIKPPDA